MKQSRSTKRRFIVRAGCAALATTLGILLAWQLGVARAAPTARGVAAQSPSHDDLRGVQIFPQDDPWNRDVSKEPIDPNSARLIASIGVGKPLHPDFGSVYNGAPMGIPYVVIPAGQPKVKVEFEYKDESDARPYPIPPDAPIEGGPKADGDRHVLVIDPADGMLYELFSAFPRDGGKWWKAGSGAIWNLRKTSWGQRRRGWTSADAAGLPVFPGLVRYDEVVGQKQINHALRFTVVKSRHGYVYPATHFASKRVDPNLPPMGMRVRLKADYDISGFSPKCQVILRALKKYGMIVADNGSNWFISGAPDPRWDNEELHTLTRVKGSAFEVVKMGPVMTR